MPEVLKIMSVERVEAAFVDTLDEILLSGLLNDLDKSLYHHVIVQFCIWGLEREYTGEDTPSNKFKANKKIFAYKLAIDNKSTQSHYLGLHNIFFVRMLLPPKIIYLKKNLSSEQLKAYKYASDFYRNYRFMTPKQKADEGKQCSPTEQIMIQFYIYCRVLQD